MVSCEKDQAEPATGVDENQEMIATRDGRHAETPFKAFYTTELSYTVVPPNLVLDITAEGNATRLGKSTFQSDSWVNITTPLPFPQTGNITFTAANGDKLYASFIGNANPYVCNEVEDCTDFVGNFVFGEWLGGVPMDGTGRFEGATGGGTYYGSANNTIAQGQITFDGVLINP